MKIAVITTGFLPIPATKGGAVENLVVNLINKNEKYKKFKFDILTIYDEMAEKEAKRFNETNFIFFKVNYLIKLLDKLLYFIIKNMLRKENSQRYRYTFQRLCFLNKCSKKLKKENYDKIILENSPTEYLALKWRKNNIKYENKYYYHAHNEFSGTFGCKKIIKKTKKFICVSQYISNKLSKKLEIDVDKFCVLRNCIDKDKFIKKVTEEEKDKLKKQYNIKNNEKVLIFVGRIVKEKGVKELLQAIEKINNKNVKLLIVGSAVFSMPVITEYQEQVEKIINKMKNKVTFTGFIDYNEIYKLYSIADISVIPSIWNDPAPLTIIESLTCGLPIITTKSGGIPEYATDESAIILDRDENLVNNLSKTIDMLLSNQELRKKMKNNCIKVANRLDINNYYKNFESIMNFNK